MSGRMKNDINFNSLKYESGRHNKTSKTKSSFKISKKLNLDK